MYAMTLPKKQEAIDITLLPELFELFLQEKKQKGRITAKTEKAYRSHTSPFMRWLEMQLTKRVTPLSLTDFLHWMQNEFRTQRGVKAAPNTVSHCVTCLRALFDWCYAQNCTGGVNLSAWLPQVKKIKSQLYFPDALEMQRLFDAVKGIDRVRDWALFAFLLSTGARRFEVALAEVDSISFNTPLNMLTADGDHRGSVWLRKVKFDAAGQGAGRNVVFCSTAGLLLKIWLRAADRHGDDTIFGLTDSGMSQVIRRATHTAQLPEISPHAFRRCFADYWDAVHGAAGRIPLKRQLGHSLGNDVTQDHYISENPRRVIAEIMKWHVSPLLSMTIRMESMPCHIE